MCGPWHSRKKTPKECALWSESYGDILGVFYFKLPACFVLRHEGRDGGVGVG